MLFSIIIPFYNTNIIYFSRMITSLSSQVYKEFEVIIVDDGSTMENANILDQFNYYDLNVRIIHQNNKGLPGARNTGIREARGRYLAFVDSDDTIPINLLSEARTFIRDYKEPDIIYGRIVYYGDDNNSMYKLTERNCRPIDRDAVKISNRQNKIKTELFCDEEGILNLKKKILHLDEKYIILGSASGSVYKKSLIENNMFDEDVRICEDQIFNRKLLQCAKKCLVVPNEWYCYIQYHSSMLHDQVKNNDLSKTFSYWDKIYYLDIKEDNFIKGLSNIHTIGLFCDEIKKMAMTGKPYSYYKESIGKMFNHPVIKKAQEISLLDNNINFFKSLLFKSQSTTILFYIYKLKSWSIY